MINLTPQRLLRLAQSFIYMIELKTEVIPTYTNSPLTAWELCLDENYLNTGRNAHWTKETSTRMNFKRVRLSGMLQKVLK